MQSPASTINFSIVNKEIFFSEINLFKVLPKSFNFPETCSTNFFLNCVGSLYHYEISHRHKRNIMDSK